MKYSLRQNRGLSRYQPYIGLAGRPSQTSSSQTSSSPSNSRPARLTRSNAVIFDQTLDYAHSAISAPGASHSVETTITPSMSMTTSFNSAGPPPDTPTSLDSTPTRTLEALNSTASFKTAGGGGNGDESGLDDNAPYFSTSSSVPVNLPPTRPTPINLPRAFKQSVRRAVQRRLRRYAGKLDPDTSREIELGISDAIDLALRILERSHRQQDIVPFTGTSTSARLRSAVVSSVLCDVASNVLEGSLNAIRFSGRRFLKVLSRGAAPKLTLMSHTTPHAYEMARLDVSSRAQSPLIPGGWDQDQDQN